MNTIYDELKRRGFAYQETAPDAIKKILNEEKIKFYVGFDPTGSSLHVGHLLPVMAMRLLQKAGHTPIVLVGGATAQIGDPSGKSAARPILTKETVAANAEAIRAQLARFISVDNGDAIFVNNRDWFEDVKYIDFLREIGSIFSVNRMLAQESVKARLENGLSFLEFNYSILQAYDFLTLRMKYNCRMELGGQDQWGNMVAGTELIRRKNLGEAYAMTIPLLLDSNGQKFGKTSGGSNVWLDTARTNVFDYYQFWRNSDDSQVAKLLGYFSTLPLEEIDRLVNASGNINRAKEILAYEATALAHGPAAAKEAFLSAGSKFGFADPQKTIATTSAVFAVSQDSTDALPVYVLKEEDFIEGRAVLTRIIAAAGLAKSSSEGRRLIQGGAVSLNGEKITDVAASLTKEDLSSGENILRCGKKNYRKLSL